MAVTQAALQAAARDRDASTRRLDRVTRDLTAAWAAAQTAQDQRLNAALAVLTAAGTAWPTRRQVVTSFPLQISLAVLQQEYARLTTRTETLVASTADTAARDAAAAQAAIIAAQLPSGVQLAAAAATVTDAVLTAIAARAARSAAASLRPLPVAVVADIRGEIIRGGRGSDLLRITDRVLADARQHSSAALARALLIARTEIADAERAAAKAVQDAAADVLIGWRWQSELAPTTCPSCWAMHGTLHPLSEPGPLDHPAGRCRRFPVLRPWSELGLPGPEPAGQFPDAQAAFAALPRADQLRIMGPGRLRLLETGRITWADLARRRDNPRWRPSYTVVPLRDLT